MAHRVKPHRSTVTSITTTHDSKNDDDNEWQQQRRLSVSLKSKQKQN